MEKIELKPGMRVKVVSRISGHEFEIGEEVTLEELEDEDSWRCVNDSGKTWWLGAEEFSPIDYENIIIKQAIDRILSDPSEFGLVKKEQADKLADALRDAVLQIDYLHGKFQETGTGNAVISKCQQTLTNYEKLKP